MCENSLNSLEQKLNICKSTELLKIDKSKIDDIANIKIDTQKSSVERILDFLLSYENPYIFKVQDSLVKIEFSNNNVYADNCITNVFRNIYK